MGSERVLFLGSASKLRELARQFFSEHCIASLRLFFKEVEILHVLIAFSVALCNITAVIFAIVQENMTHTQNLAQ